jgi:hypothetical protein
VGTAASKFSTGAVVADVNDNDDPGKIVDIAAPADAPSAAASGLLPAAAGRKPTFNARAAQKPLASASMSALLSTARGAVAAAVVAPSLAEGRACDSTLGESDSATQSSGSSGGRGGCGVGGASGARGAG